MADLGQEVKQLGVDVVPDLHPLGGPGGHLLLASSAWSSASESLATVWQDLSWRLFSSLFAERSNMLISSSFLSLMHGAIHSADQRPWPSCS